MIYSYIMQKEEKEIELTVTMEMTSRQLSQTWQEY